MNTAQRQQEAKVTPQFQDWLDAVAAIQMDIDRIIRGGEPDPVLAKTLKAAADAALARCEAATAKIARLK